MTLYLPEELRWLGWIAGAPWPDGDEDKAWEVARAWEEASKELTALLAKIDEARQATMAAYPAGAAREEMGGRFDELRTGEHSLEQIAEYMMTQYDSAFDMGTELQATKLTIILTLCWLAIEIAWAWLFPPTAPAVEAAAIVSTRSALKFIQDFVQKTITNIAARMGAPNLKHSPFWKNLVGAGRTAHWPTAKGWGVYISRAIEGAVVPMAINGGVQAGQIGQGKRHEFNGKEFGLSALGGAAGAVPAREFGKYLGEFIDKGLNKLPTKVVYNPAMGAFRGMFIGATADAFGAIFGNLATALASGADFSAFGNAAGWVGNIAQGGIVGGVRGGAAFNSYIPKGADGFSNPAGFRSDHWRGFAWWLPKYEGPGLFAPTPTPAPESSAGSSSDSSSTVTTASSTNIPAPPPGMAPDDIALQNLNSTAAPNSVGGPTFGTGGSGQSQAGLGQSQPGLGGQFSGGDGQYGVNQQPNRLPGESGNFGPAAYGGASGSQTPGGFSGEGGSQSNYDGRYGEGGGGRFGDESNGGFYGGRDDDSSTYGGRDDDSIFYGGRDEQGFVAGGRYGDSGAPWTFVGNGGPMPQHAWFGGSDDGISIHNVSGDVYMSGGAGPPGTVSGGQFRTDSPTLGGGYQGQQGPSTGQQGPVNPNSQSSSAQQQFSSQSQQSQNQPSGPASRQPAPQPGLHDNSSATSIDSTPMTDPDASPVPPGGRDDIFGGPPAATGQPLRTEWFDTDSDAASVTSIETGSDMRSDDVSLSNFPLPPSGMYGPTATPGVSVSSDWGAGSLRPAPGTGQPGLPAPGVPHSGHPVPNTPAQRPPNFSRPLLGQNGPAAQPLNFSRPFGGQNTPAPPPLQQNPQQRQDDSDAEGPPIQSFWSDTSSDNGSDSGSDTSSDSGRPPSQSMWSDNTSELSFGSELANRLGVPPGSRAAYELFRDRYAESRTEHHGTHHGAHAISHSLGEGKDVRGKPRPQRWPMRVPYPILEFRGPEVATDGWLPDGAVPKGGDDSADPGGGPAAPEPIVSPEAVVDPSASIGPGAEVQAGATVGKNAEIGEGAVIHRGAAVQEGAVVGKGAQIHAGVIVHPGAVVGAGAIVNEGAVILPGAVVPDGATVAAGEVVGGDPGTQSSEVDVPFRL
ncbi:WXG100-like domain-containing protein [Nocardia rhamnosiphila]